MNPIEGQAGDLGGVSDGRVIRLCDHAALDDAGPRLVRFKFERYDDAPAPVQEKVIAENKARLEALNKE